ncbi:SusF/SusE family outer membrane protein [Dysgonomonas sp. Marseille-P4677]|uniref:SusF/SusE family outer membrane protein n=1 Tax=Dysgonomonas sp. Marseille-P4677 TaxID=2364790 RepID=UPI0019124224|nr:SusF/SusE family outer membrane protein [Dysgonomonas sp. Marseille-P4677]MBK5721537.1 SusF/SusE family outer membrane protein [Dysgonomonas sp. Marseille-P4677]
MKKLNIFSILILSLLAFIACTDENDHIKLGDSGNFSKPALEQKVLQNFVIEDNTNLSDSIGYWKWSEAKFNVQSPSAYNIQVDTTATFNTAASVATTADSYMKLTYDILNKTALRFVSNAQEVTLYFRIKASLGTAEAEPILYSETQQITFTCRPSIKSVLYIVGNGLAGWGNDRANIGKDLQLFFADNSTDTDLKYTYTGVFNNGGLKFPTQAGVWSTTYAYEGGKLSPNNVGGDFTTGAEGLYTLSVDLKTLAITYEKYTGSVKTYAQMEVVGDAADGWGDTDGIAMQSVVEHVWFAYPVTLKAGGLKFREDKSWANNWGAVSDTQTDLPFGKTGDKNITIEDAGDYFLALNSLTGHYIVMPVKSLK